MTEEKPKIILYLCPLSIYQRLWCCNISYATYWFGLTTTSFVFINWCPDDSKIFHVFGTISILSARLGSIASLRQNSGLVAAISAFYSSIKGDLSYDHWYGCCNASNLIYNVVNLLASSYDHIATVIVQNLFWVGNDYFCTASCL